ncbi:hypothetical protein FRB94_014571 [Tulasnella sp. JGI-2019a]|nr:hypothetical protein FRB94_014571 [Tulasnella sp. JGI-2019a]
MFQTSILGFKGRLKIIYLGKYFGYVARQMSMLDKHQTYPTDIGEALIVQIPPEDQQGYARWNIELINPIPWDSECKYLGIVDAMLPPAKRPSWYNAH